MTTITLHLERPSSPPLPVTLPSSIPLGDQANIVAAIAALIRLSKGQQDLVIDLMKKDRAA